MPVNDHVWAFPPKNLDWIELTPYIVKANANLARFDATLSATRNVHVLLSPVVTQEAVLSSKIEGTQVTMGEVMEIEAGAETDDISPSKKSDAEEVIHYRHALHSCIQELEKRPFSQQVLRAAHGLLMQGVRGQDMSPGAYRTEQNWIGPKGSQIEQAHFIPISPAQLLTGMDEWEAYFNIEEKDPLVQLAIVHVEFEALHPFKDGNGRLGRMLIPLFLYQKGLLVRPDFYMSGYLEARRDEYQERLRNVSRNGEWTEWCRFFLQGIINQAASNQRKAAAMLQLYNRLHQELPELTHSRYANPLLDFIFAWPYFTPPQLKKQPTIPEQSARRLLETIEKHGIVKRVRSRRGRRPAFYLFPELLNIAEDDDAF